jgi:multicomponent Na+:H+ antiporter subunit C
MEFVLAIVIGSLYSCGIYMILRRSVAKLIIGLIMLGHASHLLIFTVARVVRAKAPVIPEGQTHLLEATADPLPQALILTAIVISFGLTAFSIILIKMLYLKTEEQDIEKMDED